MEQFISCSACRVNMMSMALTSLGLGRYLRTSGCDKDCDNDVESLAVGLNGPPSLRPWPEQGNEPCGSLVK